MNRGFCLAIILMAVRFAEAQSVWRWMSPYPTGNQLLSVAWTGTRYIAVGFSGTIISSQDGLVWDLERSGTKEHLYSVAAHDSITVVGGGNGTILTSRAGGPWVLRRGKAGERSVHFVDWTGDHFTALASSDSILTSPDGIVWAARKYTLNPDGLLSVVWTGTRYIGAGSGGVLATSDDAIDWVRQATRTEGTFWSLAWNGKIAVAVGDEARYSKDGVEWSYINLSRRCTNVIWSDSIFIAIGSLGHVATSKDGIAWYNRDGVSTSIVNSLASSGREIVGVGTQTGFATGTVVTSTNAANWTQTSRGIDEHLSGAVQVGSRTIVSSGSGGVFQIAADGSWKEVRAQPVYLPIRSMIWTGDRIAAFRDEGFVLVSTDGSVWHEERWAESGRLNSAVSNASGTVAVGYGGKIVTSDGNGVWAESASGTSNDLHSVGWDGSTFLAVGTQGTILSSRDGSSWKPEQSGTTMGLFSIIRAGDKWIAAGKAGIILISKDGKTWNGSVSGTRDWHKLAWSGRSLVAVGAGGQIAYSPDGTTWTHPESLTDQDLTSVVWANGMFIAAGDYSTLLTAEEDVVGALRPSRRNRPGLLTERRGNRFIAFFPPELMGKTLRCSFIGVDGSIRESFRMTVSGDRFETLISSPQGDPGFLSIRSDGGAFLGAVRLGK